jgi:hypothetical protein
MESNWVVPLAVAALALMGTFSIAWRSRVRAVTRWHTALNAYADREIAQERRRKALKRVRTPTALGISVRGRTSGMRVQPSPHSGECGYGSAPSAFLDDAAITPAEVCS